MEGIYNALIIIEDPALRVLIEKALDISEFSTIAAHRGQNGLGSILAGDINVAFMDLPHHSMSHDTVFRSLLSSSPPTPCIIVTEEDREQKAFEALGHGAFDYILSSDSPLRVMTMASRAIARSQSDIELRQAKSMLRQTLFNHEPSGVSAAAIALKAEIGKAAETDVNVIIEGDAGTGKRETAQRIHSMGGRQDGPFVALNCNMVPRGLLETELFGMEAGVYGHGSRVRQGRIEQASGGTLYLEDIHMLPPGLQEAILRVIRTGEVRRVGGTSSGKTDVRLMASSSSDLEALVYSGGFLNDLYQALSGARITLSPLRNHRDDIPMLLKRFMDEFSHKRGQGPPDIERPAMKRLLEYNWPGNTEELRSLAEGLCSLGQHATVTVSDLPDRIRLGAQAAGQEGGQEISGMLEVLSSVSLPEEGLSLPLMMDALESALITKALDRTGGNQGEAARLLGLNRTTLIGKIRKKDIK